MKPTSNILVTDDTPIEWLATLFQHSIRANHISVDVEWRKRPDWTHKSVISLDIAHHELENTILNLYSFPASIKRDFKLADLNIEFDGCLLITDLGNKKRWQRHINRSPIPIEVWPDNLKNAIEEHLYRVGHEDPTKIWGVELCNQLEGAKLILGIRSSSDSVPSNYIEKHFPLNSPVDIVSHDVDPNSWLNLYNSYSPTVIANTLITLEQKLRSYDS